MSRVRQNYHEECEATINKQINMVSSRTSHHHFNVIKILNEVILFFRSCTPATFICQ